MKAKLLDKAACLRKEDIQQHLQTCEACRTVVVSLAASVRGKKGGASTSGKKRLASQTNGKLHVGRKTMEIAVTAIQTKGTKINTAYDLNAAHCPVNGPPHYSKERGHDPDQE